MEIPVRSTSETPVRQVSDGHYVWTVYEHTPAYDRRSGSTLVFDCPEVVRRVRAFPSDWFALSDAELVALSANR